MGSDPDLEVLFASRREHAKYIPKAGGEDKITAVKKKKPKFADGQIVEAGTPERVLDAPESPRLVE